MILIIVLAALLTAGAAQGGAAVAGTVGTYQAEQYKPVPTEFTDSTASAAYNDYIYSETTGYDYELPLSETLPPAVKPALLGPAVPDQPSGEPIHMTTTAEEPAWQPHSTGIMWTMSAPAVLPEDLASTETDTAAQTKPTDKPGASGVSSSGGNPPETIYYMTGGTAASTQASSSTDTAVGAAVAVGSSSSEVPATAVSAPQVASSYEGGSAVNLVAGGTAPMADDVTSKSNVSSGFVCGPASTYLLLLSLFFNVAYIL